MQYSQLGDREQLSTGSFGCEVFRETSVVFQSYSCAGEPERDPGGFPWGAAQCAIPVAPRDRIKRLKWLTNDESVRKPLHSVE